MIGIGIGAGRRELLLIKVKWREALLINIGAVLRNILQEARKGRHMEAYPNINMIQTGKKIEAAIKAAGIDVRTLQKYLHLSCPQPIYRWFKGQVLPSVDHLYVISRLLGMHMEDFIVPKRREDIVFASDILRIRAEFRILSYYERVCEIAA